MLDVKKLIAKMLNAFNNAYIVETKTLAVSLNNERYKSYTLSVAKSGYTPMGLVGWSTGTVDWMMSQCYISGNRAYVYVFRTASATASATFTLHVLYRKNS